MSLTEIMNLNADRRIPKYFKASVQSGTQYAQVISTGDKAQVWLVVYGPMTLHHCARSQPIITEMLATARCRLVDTRCALGTPGASVG